MWIWIQVRLWFSESDLSRLYVIMWLIKCTAEASDWLENLKRVVKIRQAALSGGLWLVGRQSRPGVALKTRRDHATVQGQNFKKSSQLISGGSEESIYKMRLKKVMNSSVLSRSVFSKYFLRSLTDVSLTSGLSLLYRRLLRTRLVAWATPATRLSRPITSRDRYLLYSTNVSWGGESVQRRAENNKLGESKPVSS